MSGIHAENSGSWVYPASPTSLQITNSGTSDTFQATANLARLHVFSCAVDCMIEGGDGSSVTVTNGHYVKAGVPLYFVPTSGRDALGYKTLSGSAFSASDVATVSLVPSAKILSG